MQTAIRKHLLYIYICSDLKIEWIVTIEPKGLQTKTCIVGQHYIALAAITFSCSTIYFLYDLSKIIFLFIYVIFFDNQNFNESYIIYKKS